MMHQQAELNDENFPNLDDIIGERDDPYQQERFCRVSLPSSPESFSGQEVVQFSQTQQNLPELVMEQQVMQGNEQVGHVQHFEAVTGAQVEQALPVPHGVEQPFEIPKGLHLWQLDPTDPKYPPSLQKRIRKAQSDHRNRETKKMKLEVSCTMELQLASIKAENDYLKFNKSELETENRILRQKLNTTKEGINRDEEIAELTSSNVELKARIAELEAKGQLLMEKLVESERENKNAKIELVKEKRQVEILMNQTIKKDEASHAHQENLMKEFQEWREFKEFLNNKQKLGETGSSIKD